MKTHANARLSLKGRELLIARLTAGGGFDTGSARLLARRTLRLATGQNRVPNHVPNSTILGQIRRALGEVGGRQTRLSRRAT